MRYNRLTDIGLTEEQIRDNLILGDAKIGDTMSVAMRPADAKAWFGAPPPDLSVESRVRGKDWLYNYLIGVLPRREVGDRLEQPRVPERRHAARAVDAVGHEQARDDRVPEPRGGAWPRRSRPRASRWSSRCSAASTSCAPSRPTSPGTMSPVEYRAMVADLVNFMDYMGEPARNKRITLGIVVMLFLGVLFFFAYWLKREYWKDVH